MKITDREKKFLLEIARESMRSWMSGAGFRYEPSLQPIISLDRPTVLEDGGAMISLYKDGKLIAHTEKLDQKYPLFLVVRDISNSVIYDNYANEDTLGFNDINNIDIVLSVLSPVDDNGQRETITFNEKQFGLR